MKLISFNKVIKNKKKKTFSKFSCRQSVSQSCKCIRLLIYCLVIGFCYRCDAGKKREKDKQNMRCDNHNYMINVFSARIINGGQIKVVKKNREKKMKFLVTAKQWKTTQYKNGCCKFWLSVKKKFFFLIEILISSYLSVNKYHKYFLSYDVYGLQ